MVAMNGVDTAVSDSGSGSIVSLCVCVIVCMLVRIRTNINRYAVAAPGRVARCHRAVISLTLTHAFTQVCSSAQGRDAIRSTVTSAFPLLPHRLRRSNIANVVTSAHCMLQVNRVINIMLRGCNPEERGLRALPALKVTQTLTDVVKIPISKISFGPNRNRDINTSLTYMRARP